jgi:putative tryptophan/tyrosine transport system substrate-binding protein
MIRRREFIAGLGSAVAWPLIARAQQSGKLLTIGVLSGAPAGSYAPPEFRQGLSQAGFEEGRNVALEYHWVDGRYDLLPALAADFVHRQVAVIVTGGIAATLAAKGATATIPIVFSVGIDPVELGLVASLNRPGGNVTGVTQLARELMPKRLELLRDAVPATVIAALINPTEQNAGNPARDLPAAARNLGVQLHVLKASAERDFDAVFATLVQLSAGGLVIAPDAVLNSRSAKLAALALRYELPAISSDRRFAAAGGLMTYGNDVGESGRLAGVYAGRILKGEKPADLPVQQATRVELVINLKTAKTLGITIPPNLLAIADEVIE